MRPSVTITLKRNGLRRVPPSPAQVCVTLGVCSAGTPNVLASFGDISALQTGFGQGSLVENLADRILGDPNLGTGGSQFGVPITPSVAGAVGATDTTHVAGTATVVGSAVPAYTIDLKIGTGGVLGTMTVQYRVNGGAYSAPVLSTITSFPLPIPGSLTTATFSAHTYTAGDVWTISTLGAISVVGAGTGSWVTQVSSTLDVYDVVTTILVAGALGAAQFQVSVDGGVTLSPAVLVPSSGLYAIPLTGILLTFAGTFVAADVYEFKTTSAGFGTSDATAAVVALRAAPVEWGFIVVHGMGANSAAAAALAAAMDTQMVACELEFRYVFAIVECPTNGSPGGSTESNATVSTTFSTFFSERVMVVAGDIKHKSAISSQVIRRNGATAVATRIACISPGTDPAEVGDPEAPLPRVIALYDDSATDSTLDSNRFCTLTSMRGLDGFFVTNGNMMAPVGSDFYLVQYRRIIDTAERVARARLLVILSRRIRTDPSPDPAKLGTIHPIDRAKTKADLIHYMNAAVVPADAQDTQAEVSATEKILTTGVYPVALGVTPYGYAKQITATLGLVNPSA